MATSAWRLPKTTVAKALHAAAGQGGDRDR